MMKCVESEERQESQPKHPRLELTHGCFLPAPHWGDRHGGYVLATRTRVGQMAKEEDGGRETHSPSIETPDCLDLVHALQSDPLS
jgi:hypothetical protein